MVLRDDSHTAVTRMQEVLVEGYHHLLVDIDIFDLKSKGNIVDSAISIQLRFKYLINSFFTDYCVLTYSFYFLQTGYVKMVFLFSHMYGYNVDHFTTNKTKANTPCAAATQHKHKVYTVTFRLLMSVLMFTLMLMFMLQECKSNLGIENIDGSHVCNTDNFLRLNH